MIIDYTYFRGEILIAGLASTPVQDSVTLIMGKREPEYLKKAIGYAFYKLFTDGLAVQPVEDVEDRWTDLRDGAEYVNSQGHTKEWTGFANDEKLSPIANYAYYWIRRNDVTFTTTVGEKEGKSDNANNASMDIKGWRAWNEMVSQNKVLYDFLLNKKDEDGALVYPEFAIEEVDCELTKRMSLI